MNAEPVEIILNEPFNNATINRNIDQIPPIQEDLSFLDTEEDSALTLKLTSHGARLESDNDPNYFKNISLKSLAKVIMDDANLDTGFLPLAGKNYSGIRRYVQVKDKHFVFIERKLR